MLYSSLGYMGTPIVGDTKDVFGMVESLKRIDINNCELLPRTNFRSISGRGQTTNGSDDRLSITAVTDIFES
jgi:hypothetical protein